MSGNSPEAHGFEKLRGVRVEKMERLREAGLNPYPYRFDQTHFVDIVRENEASLTKDETAVSLAAIIIDIRGSLLSTL